MKEFLHTTETHPDIGFVSKNSGYMLSDAVLCYAALSAPFGRCFGCLC